MLVLRRIVAVFWPLFCYQGLKIGNILTCLEAIGQDAQTASFRPGNGLRSGPTMRLYAGQLRHTSQPMPIGLLLGMDYESL